MIIDNYTQLGPTVENHRTQLLQPVEKASTAEELIAAMDRVGIDRAVTFAPRWVGGEFVDPTYEQANRTIHSAVQQFPDRLIGYARVNPNYGSAAVQELQTCLEDFGFKGLMLDSEWENFFPGDQKLAYPLFETARKHKVPVLFHSWYCPSEPGLFWQVADDFPEVPVIIGHLGGRLTADAEYIAQRAPNVYLETSDHMYRMSVYARSIGCERVLFGSNMPFSGPESELFKVTRCDDLSQEQKDLILGGNSARLHGLA